MKATLSSGSRYMLGLKKTFMKNYQNFNIKDAHKLLVNVLTPRIPVGYYGTILLHGLANNSKVFIATTKCF